MSGIAFEAESCENESEETTEPIENQEVSMRRMYFRRLATPPITINRNGSRYISPFDIVRSKAGREEIQRQQRPIEKDEKRTGEDAATANRKGP